MQNAIKTTAADLKTLISSINNQLSSRFIQGAERKQLESFRRTLESQLIDLETNVVPQ